MGLFLFYSTLFPKRNTTFKNLVFLLEKSVNFVILTVCMTAANLKDSADVIMTKASLNMDGDHV